MSLHGALESAGRWSGNARTRWSGWTWHHYPVYRQRYAAAARDPGNAHLTFCRVTNRADARRLFIRPLMAGCSKQLSLMAALSPNPFHPSMSGSEHVGSRGEDERGSLARITRAAVCPHGVANLTAAYVAWIISVMSKNVSVIVTDDLDGSENAETVSFGFEGVSYEIDLAKKNRAKLEKALAPFIEAGRRVPRGGRRGAGRTGGSSADRSAVRAWAREAGLQVSERGRVSADVMRQYEAAH